MSTQTTLGITEDVTDVSVSGDTIEVSITDDVTELKHTHLLYLFEVPGQIGQQKCNCTPYNTITATNLETALKGISRPKFSEVILLHRFKFSRRRYLV